MFSVGSIAMVAGSAWDECNAHDWFQGVVVRRGPKQIKLQFADGPQLFNFTQDELENHQRRFANAMALETGAIEDLVEEFGKDAPLHLLADAMHLDPSVVAILERGRSRECGLAGLCAVAKKEAGEDEDEDEDEDQDEVDAKP